MRRLCWVGILGPLGVVGDEPGGCVAVGVRQVGAHGGHDGPVADGERADMALLKEFLVCHGALTSVVKVAVVVEVTGVGHGGDGKSQGKEQGDTMEHIFFHLWLVFYRKLRLI